MPRPMLNADGLVAQQDGHVTFSCGECVHCEGYTPAEWAVVISDVPGCFYQPVPGVDLWYRYEILSGVNGTWVAGKYDFPVNPLSLCKWRPSETIGRVRYTYHHYGVDDVYESEVTLTVMVEHGAGVGYLSVSVAALDFPSYLSPLRLILEVPSTAYESPWDCMALALVADDERPCLPGPAGEVSYWGGGHVEAEIL